MKINFSKVDIIKSDTKIVSKILKSGWLTHGEYTKKFEDKFKKFTSSKYAITVSNCTAGLHLICLALGLTKNDEVIVPAMSHVATAHAATYTGARVRFADVNKLSGNIELEEVIKKYNKKTKAIIVVHMTGIIVSDIKKIRKFCDNNHIYLIEDCAHALGTKYFSTHVGNFGHAAAFSFYPTKQITTGEGGMVITNFKKIENKVRKLKAFGIDTEIKNRKMPGKYDVLKLGYNYRMTDFQAAIGLRQLERYKLNLIKRRKNAKIYESYLKNTNNIQFIKFNKNYSYFIFQIFVKESLRDKIVNNLKDNNIGCSIHYAKTISDYSFYKKINKKEKFENAIKYSKTNISLPVHKFLEKKQIKFICDKIKKLLK